MLRDSLWIIIVTLLVINTFGAIITVFSQKRDIATIWAWLLVLLTLPVVGFFVFFLMGSRISNKKIFRLRTQDMRGLEQIAYNQRQQLEKIEELLPVPDSASELVRLFLTSDDAVLTRGNEIQIFTNGFDKFNALFEDIEQATHHIHLEYFTIYDDKIGNQLIDLLTKKA